MPHSVHRSESLIQGSPTITATYRLSFLEAQMHIPWNSNPPALTCGERDSVCSRQTWLQLIVVFSARECIECLGAASLGIESRRAAPAVATSPRPVECIFGRWCFWAPFPPHVVEAEPVVIGMEDFTASVLAVNPALPLRLASLFFTFLASSLCRRIPLVRQLQFSCLFPAAFPSENPWSSLLLTDPEFSVQSTLESSSSPKMANLAMA